MQRLKFIIFSLSLILLVNCQGQEKNINSNSETEISIILQGLKQDTLTIEYEFPSLSLDSLKFIFPNIIPGTYQCFDRENYIHNLICFDQNNKKIVSIKENNNSYLIPESKKLKKIRYQINNNSIFNTYKFLTETSVTDSFAIINPCSSFGYLEQHTNIPYSLKIEKNGNVSTHYYNSNVTKTTLTDSFRYESYNDLVNNPLLYCRPDTISFKSDDLKISITVYSDNKNITSSLLASWINPLTKILSDYSSKYRKNGDAYRGIFIFSNKFDTETALEYKDASVFCFRANWDTVFLKEKLQKFFLHEFLHTFTPIYFHSNTYQKNGYQDYNSKHLWLYEGVTEYLSLKTLLASNQIDTLIFFNELSRLFYLFNQYKECNKIPILKISENILNKTYSNCFDNFYYKGALLAFIIDVEVSINSKGKSNLFLELINYIKLKGNIFDEQNLINDLSCSAYLSNFNFKVVDTNFEESLTNCLQKIGYSISNNIIMSIEYATNDFGIKEYYLNENTYKILINNNFIKNKHVDLIKVNKKNINKENFFNLLIYPPDATPIEIEYISGNEIKKITIRPSKELTTFRFKEIKSINNKTFCMFENMKYYTKHINN